MIPDYTDALIPVYMILVLRQMQYNKYGRLSTIQIPHNILCIYYTKEISYRRQHL